MKHQSHSPSRRNFLQSSLTLAGGLSVLPADANPDHKLAIIPKIQKGHWYQKPLRILQTVLRESDAGKYDARSVVNYMQKAHCNVLVVNAGGIVDFFQNPLPASNINPFMGSRDILKEITDLCKTAGIRVIARVDFRGVEEHVYNKYLNWFSYNSDGSPMQLNYTRPKLYASCYTGYYRNEHAIDFLKYLLTHYAIDGIWHNSIGVGGICHCDNCKASWHRFSGREMPTQDSSSELQDAYMQWKSKVADEHMETMKNTVKSFGDDKVYTAEIFSMFEAGQRIHSGIDLYNARDHFDFMVSVAFLTENSDRIHYEDLSYAGTIIRFLKSIAPQKEAIILYGGNGTAHRYVMDPSEDLKVWLWQALAAGG
ncbi:MAG: hypothetical protein JJU28_25315, partial [Cyclobacteriaceae bacterium]|nr:hypothetical protein [Cyclobacteriaceae bacterium]